MAVTTQTSTQIANAAATPEVKNLVYDNGKVRFAYFNFTQDGDGDANSTVDLVNLGPGRYRIIPILSRLTRSALGTGRTLDIGYTAYTDIYGVSQSAAADVIVDGLDVSSAGSAYMGTGTNADLNSIPIESRGDFIVQAKCLGDTLADAVTLEGWIAYVRD